MQIEQAVLKDSETLLTLQKLAYQSEAERYGDDSLPPLRQSLAEMKADILNQVVLKVIIDNRIVGSVRAYEQNGTCLIGRLVVHPDFQKRGIGTRLMREIELRFGRSGRFELFTGHASEEALRLYGRLGYAEFKRQALSTHTLVYLEKWSSAWISRGVGGSR